MTKAKLFDAVQSLDLKAVRAILDAKPQLLEVRDQKGRNILHVACAVPGDARKMVDLLLDRGLDVESRSLGKDECTPLFFAVARSRDPKLVAHRSRMGRRRRSRTARASPRASRPRANGTNDGPSRCSRASAPSSGNTRSS
jgi:hypothetical protein